jgi:hypothetical protein
MENFGQAITWFIQIGTLIAVGAAAIGALKLIRVTRDQVQQTLEARYDQYRPLLVPDGSKFTLTIGQAHDLQGREYPYADLNHPRYNVALVNIGSGHALNVRGVMYGSPPIDNQPTRHHYFKFGGPILSGHDDEESSEIETVIIPGETTIGRDRQYNFYAPPLPSLDQILNSDTPTVVARLIVTYRDIFNRKHASIFDYTFQQEWRSVDGGFLPDIPKDIEDLDHDERMKRAAVQTRYREQLSLDQIFPGRRLTSD